MGTRLDLLAAFRAARPSVRERLDAGRALRQSLPRSAHAEFTPAPGRREPVEVLQEQNAERLASLVPVRTGRMAASPFAFLRGSAAIMAADLAGTPATGYGVMACGDMHLMNFGLFASAERNLTFAINDFDEVHPGPWEWDLKRLAASVAVAIGFLGGDRHDASAAVRATVASYTGKMRDFAEMGVLEVWYSTIDEDVILSALPKQFTSSARRVLDRARGRGHIRSLEKLTRDVGGARVLIDRPPIIVRETHVSGGLPIEHAMEEMLEAYLASLAVDRQMLLRRYRICDAVRKVVGVGSVGTSCWAVLLEGHGPEDPLFLQIKEARPSVLAPFAAQPSPVANEGHRVVIGQRMIQGSPDIFLGWGPRIVARHGDFYVRQLADMKGGQELREGDRDEARTIIHYCRLCGWALALAHAKSGDAALISGYCGTGDALPDALAGFARAYADQTERDHDALIRAIRAGRLAATEGV